jgi:uncharacterized membrane protein
MTHSILLMTHISAAVVGLLSGFLSMAFRKGSGLHRASGTVFFAAMLTMSSTAAFLAAFIKPNAVNLLVALLTFYLVGTAWRAGRKREGGTDRFDMFALLFILAVALFGLSSGMGAAGNPRGMKDGMPAFLYFVFGTMALVCGINDIRMVRRGGLFGNQRIARHLWRMCGALLIATMSFFPGQARQLPEWLRESGLLVLPHLFLVGSMIFWRYRYRTRKPAITPVDKVARASGRADAPVVA